MKILFVFIIYIVILLTKEDYVNENDYKDEKQEIKQSLIDIRYNLYIILKAVTENTSHTSVSYNKCVKNMMEMNKTGNDALINETLRKIYEGSSKGFIDLSGFYNCINIKDDKNDFNYYTIYPKIGDDKKGQINTFNNKTIEEDLWIFGICLIFHAFIIFSYYLLVKDKIT